MNQILITNDENGNSVLGIKPIARFFAILIIIIALIFAGESGYKLYESRKSQNEFPRATIETNKVGSTLNIKFKDEVPINKIEYAWNDGKATSLKGIGRKEFSIDIEIPQNENKLTVVVIDVNGNKTKFKDIIVEFSEDEDTIKPTIKFEKGSTTGKLVIVANDDRALDYITYKWEDGETIKVDATEENQTEIRQEVNVEKGTKKIIVLAADKSENRFEDSKTIVGSTGAKITVSISEGNFVVKVVGDNNITKILYTHNDIEHTVPDIPKDAKEFEFKVPLQDGINLLKINAFEDEIMTEYKCKKTK